MIVKTFKLKKRGLIVCGGILIALLAILIVFGVVHKVSAKNYSMKTESDRQRFMSEMGWKVSEEYTSCKVVSIPDDFNDTYESYNELQKDQGFNLKKYKGEMVEIYTYEVYNYPGKSENVVINLMVFEDKLIGGDVSCNELDGFMQGLKNSNSDDESDQKSESENSSNKDSDKSDSSEIKNKTKKKEKKKSSKSDNDSSESDKEDAKNTFDSSEAQEESTASSSKSEKESTTTVSGDSSSNKSNEISTGTSSENMASQSQNQ